MDTHKQEITAHILLVEDDPLTAKAIKIILEDRHCSVEIAATGEAAIDQLNEQHHLVLLDLELPGMKGLEVAQHIRQSEKNTASVPIVILTMRQEQEKLRQARAIGVNGFLAKPLSPNKCNILLDSIFNGAA